jgi:hypothetical protein
MAESLELSATQLFKSTETKGIKDRLPLIVRSLRGTFAGTNDRKCVFIQPID